MNFKGHLRAGLVASALSTVVYSLSANDSTPDAGAMVFTAVLVGSLVPDLDTNSIPSKITALLGSIFCLWSLITKEPYPALIFATGFLFIKSFNHRTWTHLWSLPTILIAVAVKYNIPLLIPFSVGIMTHYVIDCYGPKKMYPWMVSNWIKPIKIF